MLEHDHWVPKKFRFFFCKLSLNIKGKKQNKVKNFFRSLKSLVFLNEQRNINRKCHFIFFNPKNSWKMFFLRKNFTSIIFRPKLTNDNYLLNIWRWKPATVPITNSFSIKPTWNNEIMVFIHPALFYLGTVDDY